MVVALVWHLYATDRFEDHPRVNTAELNLILAGRARDVSAVARRRTPWRLICSCGSVCGMVLSCFCLGYSAYVFYTWCFIYLVRDRGLTVTQGRLAGTPPLSRSSSSRHWAAGFLTARQPVSASAGAGK
jgi:hypothetical protein